MSKLDSLSDKDFKQIYLTLASLDSFKTVNGRKQFLQRALALQPDGQKILNLIEIDGMPLDAASSVATKLRKYGAIKDGPESLGILLNHALDFFSETDKEALALQDIIRRYELDKTVIPSKTISQDSWHGSDNPEDVQEKIIGEDTLKPIHYLELALRASKSVVKIVRGSGSGSGFLCGPNLIMTNNHVIASKSEAQDSEFLFNFELSIDGEPQNAIRVKPISDGLFYTNQTLDFTVIETEPIPTTIQPLKLRSVLAKNDDRVNIIQHPGGYFKQISMQNNFVVYADKQIVQYVTSTNPGSSGSPVFNDHFEVIAIHHSGGNLLDPKTNRKYLRNAGSSMVSVLQDLQTNAATIAGLLN